jgi:hypothetical protein
MEDYTVNLFGKEIPYSNQKYGIINSKGDYDLLPVRTKLPEIAGQMGKWEFLKYLEGNVRTMSKYLKRNNPEGKVKKRIKLTVNLFKDIYSFLSGG